ncbi:MAG: PAS domain S-box protein [Eubacteriaceae bacterium]|jgi:transcriptional regulator with PAS, ATPase and Fis domain
MDAYMLDSFIGIFTTVVLIIAVALAVVVVILFKNRQQLEEKEKERDNDRHIRDMMLDSVSEFVMVFDQKLDILWINEPGAAFLMKPSEKIIGSNLHRIPVIFEKEGLEKNLREALKKRRIYTDTLDLIQGASRIPHHVTIQRYLSGDREVFLFTASNIRKEIEEDSFRKGQREKITEIESLGKLGYWELSNESRQVTWSRGLYTILGYDLNSIRPNLDFMYRMVLPEDQNASNRAFVAAFQDQKPVDQMLRIRNNQGEELRIILRIRHSFDRENNLVSTMGFMQDITEVISLENSLSYERNLSKAILDHSDILVFVTDSSGAIVLVNSYLQKLVGLDEKELIGKQAEDYFGGVTRESMNRFLKNALF